MAKQKINSPHTSINRRQKWNKSPHHSRCLLAQQIFIEQMQVQRWIRIVFLQQFLQVVCVARELANGIGLAFDEMLFQIVGNL